MNTKKLFLVASVLLIAFTCALTSFAGHHGHVVSWDESGTLDSNGNSLILGKSLNDKSVINEQNQLRRSWTPNRTVSPDNATFVKLENGASDGVCVKIINTEFMTNDPESDGRLVGLGYIAIDLRCDKVGTFCGIVIDFENEPGFNDTNYADFEATNESFILSTGYGFTILENGKIRAFINADGEMPTYFDFDLPFDPKTEFHNYGIYKDEDASEAYLTVDGKYIAKYEFPGVKSKQGIYDANGNGVALGAEEMTGNGNIWVAFLGECEVYMDNVVYNEYEEYPEPLKTASDATEAPADATEAPAEATEAPTEATEAPTEATDAPAEATKAPADSTAEPKKEGCGNMISGGAIVLAAACAVVLKKKEH